jgi:ABC-type polysaccharide/polyol phosphate export permease
MLILSFVFSHLMRFKIENFALFILSGILVWNLFSQSLVIGVNSIVANGSLLRKVQVPATLFPLASVCSVLVNFVLALGPYILFAFFSGVPLNGWLLALPIILVPYLVFIFGVALFLATLNVSFRDVGHVLEPLLLMTFYATPVLYPIDQLPEKYARIISLNPMTHFLREIRTVLFDGAAPDPRTFAITCALAVIALILGLLVYRKNRDRFVYNL